MSMIVMCPHCGKVFEQLSHLVPERPESTQPAQRQATAVEG